VLADGRLGNPQLVRGGRDRAGGDVCAQDFHLATGGPPKDGRHGHALLAMTASALEAIRVRLISTNDGRDGT
jgi:hypothetical protein